MKKKESRRAPSFMEPLEQRRLLSGSHTVSTTKLTFSTDAAASSTLGQPISMNVAAKITSNGLPLRTATIYFVVDGQNLIGQGVSGRSGYVTGTFPSVFAGSHTIQAFFLRATRYAASQSRGTAVSVKVPALTTTADGLQYATVSPGSGSAAVSGQTVSLDYVGYLTTGSLFDTSIKGDFSNPLKNEVIDSGGLITGFNEGLKGMKVGETRLLIIPPALGYGNPSTNSSIPDNSTLVFFVKLESIA